MSFKAADLVDRGAQLPLDSHNDPYVILYLLTRLDIKFELDKADAQKNQRDTRNEVFDSQTILASVFPLKETK